jgi:hypothetical protein
MDPLASCENILETPRGANWTPCEANEYDKENIDPTEARYVLTSFGNKISSLPGNME